MLIQYTHCHKQLVQMFINTGCSLVSDYWSIPASPKKQQPLAYILMLKCSGHSDLVITCLTMMWLRSSFINGTNTQPRQQFYY